MLIEFRVKNYRSIRDEQVLSLVASSDVELLDNTHDTGKLRLLKSAAIYGHNASGKSNIIRAIHFARNIILNSAQMAPKETFDEKPFLLDKAFSEKPSEFEFTFIHEGIRYQYGFTLDQEKIHQEWLYSYPKEYKRTLFERQKQKWNMAASNLKGAKSELANKTRPNALFLSVAAQWNHEQLTNIFEWFKDHLRVVRSKTNFVPVTQYLLLKDKSETIHKYIELFLRSADLGISNFQTEKLKIDIDDLKFPSDMSIEARNKILENIERFPPTRTEFTHFNFETNYQTSIPLEEESDGTKRLFELCGPWLDAVTNGMTVFIDELEASLHPLLTRKLMTFFHDKDINKTNAQLIFTTHDTTLLDPEIIRRDQIWFTEKMRNGATELFSLSDFKGVRKDEALQKNYLTGRYGAIGIIEAFKGK